MYYTERFKVRWTYFLKGWGIRNHIVMKCRKYNYREIGKFRLDQCNPKLTIYDQKLKISHDFFYNDVARNIVKWEQNIRKMESQMFKNALCPVGRSRLQ